MKKLLCVIISLCSVFLLFCKPKEVENNDVNEVTGIIKCPFVFLTKPAYKYKKPIIYPLEMFQSVILLNDGNLIDNKFYTVKNPHNERTIYIDKVYIFYDKSFSTPEEQEKFIRNDMYKRQLSEWNISNKDCVLMSDRDIVNQLTATNYLHVTNLEEIDDYNNYISTELIKEAEYFTDINYHYDDKDILIHVLQNHNLISNVIITKGSYSDDISIGMTKADFCKKIGINDNYSIIIKNITCTDNSIKYKTGDYSFIFFFNGTRNDSVLIKAIVEVEKYKSLEDMKKQIL